MANSILVVDDEPLARERLKRLIEDLPDYEVCAEAENGESALALAAQYQPDIILMDIRMPGMDGLATAEQISKLKQSPALIFCTAYDDYAIKAFKVNATDYLLKPVRKEALEEALDRTSRLNKMQKNTEQGNEPTKTLVARTYKGTVLIDLRQALYFMADQKYVTAYLEDKELLIDNTLKELENEFPEDLIRVHRSTLVCRNKVSALTRDAEGQHCLEINNPAKSDSIKVPVSRRHTQEIKEWLKTLGRV